MECEMEFHEGDVFRWSYQLSYLGIRSLEGKADSTPYWCCARIAVVESWEAPHDLILRDIYWGPSGIGIVSGRRWEMDQAARDLILEHLGNLKDYDPAPFGADPVNVYEQSDLLDLRHSNGGVCYVRKGARPSLSVQIDWARRLLGVAQDDVVRCQAKLNQLLDEEDKVWDENHA